MENNEDIDLGQEYASFQKHVYEGNWDAANQFLSSHPEAVNAQISVKGGTALHIAVLAGHMNIVEKLVERMSEESLKIKDEEGVTVLGCSALVGNIEMAKYIIGKCPTLLRIGNTFDEQLIPVVFSLAYNSNGTEMSRYLYSETPLEDLMPENGVNGPTFIIRCIYARAFDMALDLLQQCPALAIALDIYGQSPVFALASMPSAFPSGNQLIFWKQWIYNRISIQPAHATDQIPISIQKSEKVKYSQLPEINKIYELKLLHHQSKEFLLRICEELPGLSFQQLKNGLVDEAIFKAVEKGMVEFLSAILNACPKLVRTEGHAERNTLMCAVKYRQSEVFHLLFKILSKNAVLSLSKTDCFGNNILHMAAMLAPPSGRGFIPGPALQMQSELRWYKDIERIVHPISLHSENQDHETPQELFTKQHCQLASQGEKWMKDTATSCTVIGALIVTIMFAAAFTVPGGYNQNTGLPMFLNEKAFMLFIISDALSLLSASTSVLTFLDIFTSRYAEEDFLELLPKKLMRGLSSLIFSIATMMIAFCSAIWIILSGKSRMVIPVICLASVPVALFALIELRLLRGK